MDRHDNGTIQNYI
ncbi:hypothetical protein ACN42_g11831, partial [Penicillium freii]